MDYFQFLSKLVNIVHYDHSWIKKYDDSGLKRDSGLFILLKEFSEINGRTGDDSKIKNKDNPTTIELAKKILLIYKSDVNAKNFFDNY